LIEIVSGTTVQSYRGKRKSFFFPTNFLSEAHVLNAHSSRQLKLGEKFCAKRGLYPSYDKNSISVILIPFGQIFASLYSNHTKV
jgi:hypothetical protein